jgi:hypothetical protein
MWKHISKAIAKRSSAIRTALDKYNALAPLQDPPCPILQFSDVASYSWLGDFNLLKFSSTDVMQKLWTVPANREVANKFFQVVCTQEEIKRLNVKIRRLDAWVQHEDHILLLAVHTATDPHLVRELRRHYAQCRHVNCLHRAWIAAIYCLEGYSGPGPFVPPQDWQEEGSDGLISPEGPGEDNALIDEDNTVQDEVLWLGDFLDMLMIM